MKSKPIQLLYLLQGVIAVFMFILAWCGYDKYLTLVALLITLALSLIVLTEKSITPKGKLREILEAMFYVIALCYLSFTAGRMSGDTIKILSSPTPKHLIWFAIPSAFVNFGPYFVPLINVFSGDKSKYSAQTN